MSFRRKSVTIDVDASGDADVDVPINGAIEAIHYVKDDYADGVDFVITDGETSVSLWTDSNVNAAEVVYPRVILSDGVGAAITDPKYGRIIVCGQVNIVVDEGGVSKGGTFLIDFED